jgi:acetyl esterase/lipase
MLRQTAEARDGADMTTAEWRAAYDSLGQMFSVVPDTCFSEVDAGGVRAEWVAAPTADAGVDVTLTVADDMLHVWHFFAGAVPEADEAVARVGEFIAKVAS